MTPLRTLLNRFARDDGGSMMAEFVLVLPLFLWAYMGLYVYWDGFRALNLAQKASYSIADYITRERDTFKDTEIAGMQTTFKFLMDSDQSVKMRFTSVIWNPLTKRFEVRWSRSPGNTMPELTNTTIQNYALRIPALADGVSAMVVETKTSYSPAFDVGMGQESLENFIVTQPRFLTRICLESAC